MVEVEPVYEKLDFCHKKNPRGLILGGAYENFIRDESGKGRYKKGKSKKKVDYS